MENDLEMAASIWEMTVSIWEMTVSIREMTVSIGHITVSIWDILLLCNLLCPAVWWTVWCAAPLTNGILNVVRSWILIVLRPGSCDKVRETTYTLINKQY